MLLCRGAAIKFSSFLSQDMDFGVETSATEASLGAAEFVREKGHGSTNLKHQRSGLLEDRWRLPKIPRPGEVDFSSKKASESSVAFGRSNLWPSEMDDDLKMLSFTSSEPPFGGGMPGGGSGRSITFSVSQSEHHSRTGGSGSSDGMRGPFGRLKGPFTPSQWMELEHQALIYKHIVANVPVPSNLLLPLRRSLCSYGSDASNFLGWAPFHLGFSGSNDPEPGRCRRTDGKKWRCSRDAVPDQKYCERHINRGRHRSRKPVEGHTGHAASGSATSKVAPVASSSSALVMSMSSSSASDSLCAMQNQLSSLQPNTGSALVNHGVRSSQGFQGLSITPPTSGLKSKDVPFSIQKHLPFEELSNPEFGLVSTDSLLNPSERTPYIDNSNSGSFLQFDPKEEANDKHPVHDFIDDWPKDHTHRASGSWPEELRSDWTQLSMSIPVAPDFSSSSSSPAQEKSTLSILRLSHELDPIQMSLGVSNDRGQPIQKQSSWLPVAWENSMGGPLGEVLTPTTTGAGVGEGSSLKAWNSSSQVGSSPSGVLQKSTLVSLSNSSSASSPPGPEQKST